MDMVERARREQGMSQERLAEFVEVSQSQMSRMLSAERPTTLPELFKICAALNLDPAVLIAQADT